jgi:hypothetical protein
MSDVDETDGLFDHHHKNLWSARSFGCKVVSVCRQEVIQSIEGPNSWFSHLFNKLLPIAYYNR